MRTLFDEIVFFAKQEKPVKVYFDMDGVLTSFDLSKDYNPINVKYGYYESKRPIVATIEFAKKVSEIPNVQVYILSSCCYPNQIEEKKIWLEKNANFFNSENIKVVCWEDYDLTKTYQYSIKASILEQDFDNSDSVIFFIDDDFRNLTEANKSGKIKVYHVCSLFDSMQLK